MKDMHDMKGHGSHPEKPEPPHNMVVVGEKTAFLSHLPMFMTPHNFQVILEATFADKGKDVLALYTKDRQSHPHEKIYTLEPIDRFKLPTLFTPPAKPTRATFKGKVYRGHLERGGELIKGLTNIDVNVKRVVYARQLTPELTKPDVLTYILFGQGDELFMAHRIATAPDFDQIISVKIDNAPTDEELERGVEVVFLNRENSVPQRLKEKEKATGRGHVTGAHQFLELQIQVNVEFYFEEGELLEEDTLDPTEEEIKAGFGE